MIANGADRVHFSLFEKGTIERFRRRIAALSIEERPPKTIEVPKGVLTAGESPGEAKLRPRGVCDDRGNMINSSVGLRGGQTDARIREPAASVLREAPRDPRPVCYLGDLRYHRGHYGHFLLDTFSRAWNWHVHDHAATPVLLGSQIPGYAQEIYGLVPGLSESLSLVSHTTKFRHVVIPSPSFVLDRAAHVQFRALCELVADRVDGDVVTDRPLYLSRAGLDPTMHRTIIGEEELERLLSAEGFSVVHPEKLSVSEQIRLIKSHRYVVSPMGSACHTRVFSKSTKLMLVISPDRLDVNHVLCDLLSDGEAHYANLTCVPELMIEDSLPPYALPLLLDGENVLAILKDLGLIRASAAFEVRPPGIEQYKLRWLQTAKWFFDKRGGEGLRRSIEQVTKSLGAPELDRSPATRAFDGRTN